MENFACHLQRHEAGLMRHRVLTGLGSPAQLAPAACSGQSQTAAVADTHSEREQHASSSSGGRVLFFKLSTEVRRGAPRWRARGWADCARIRLGHDAHAASSPTRARHLMLTTCHDLMACATPAGVRFGPAELGSDARGLEAPRSRRRLVAASAAATPDTPGLLRRRDVCERARRGRTREYSRAPAGARPLADACALACRRGCRACHCVSHPLASDRTLAHCTDNPPTRLKTCARVQEANARQRAEEIVGRIERLETAGDHSFSRHPLAVAARAALKPGSSQGQDGATLLLQVALQARGAAAAMLLAGDQNGIHAKLVRQAPGCPIPASGVMNGSSVAALLQAGGLLQAATLSGGDLALGYVEDAAAAAGEELLVLSPETLRQGETGRNLQGAEGEGTLVSRLRAGAVGDDDGSSSACTLPLHS